MQRLGKKQKKNTPRRDRYSIRMCSVLYTHEKKKKEKKKRKGGGEKKQRGGGGGGEREKTTGGKKINKNYVVQVL